MLVVRAVIKGFVWDTVVFQCVSDTTAVIETSLGDKKFWMNKGDKVKLWMSKHMWRVGEQTNLNQIVTVVNELNFNWVWDD